MSFRDDGDALRRRVDALEDELARTKAEAEHLRTERDQALNTPRTPEVDVRSGAKIWVEWSGTWWAATVIHEVGPGLTRIHYDGWSARWDENVGPSRIAPRDRPPPGKRGGLAPSSLWLVAIAVIVIGVVVALAIAPPSTTPPPPGVPAIARQLVPDEVIWIEWMGDWYVGNVIFVEGNGDVRVHYRDWDESSDETVTIDRVHRER